MTLPSSLAPPLHLFLLWTRSSKTLNTYLLDTIQLFNLTFDAEVLTWPLILILITTEYVQKFAHD